MRRFAKVPPWLAASFALGFISLSGVHAEVYQPVLHLRKTTTPPAFVTKLQYQATASRPIATTSKSSRPTMTPRSTSPFSMGVFYPNCPRADGVLSPTGNNCIGLHNNNDISSTILLTNRTVTGVYSGCFYIQCPEHGHVACGIRVKSGETPAVGSKATVTGALIQYLSGELAISLTSASFAPGGTMPATAGLSSSQIGSGIDLVGALLMCWGKVSGLSQGTAMTIDDGGTPIHVAGPTGAATAGAYVRVSGVLSTESTGARVLRTRTANDVRVMSP